MDSSTASQVEFVCPLPEDTVALARRLSTALRGGEWLLLSGGLGAGKTTFVRGLAQGLGYEGTVRSPTFALVAAYPTRPRLVHVDLYRLEHPSAVEDLGIDDLAEELPSVVAVEWPELLGEVPASDPVLTIGIELLESGRLLSFHARSEAASYLVEAVQSS